MQQNFFFLIGIPFIAQEITSQPSKKEARPLIRWRGRLTTLSAKDFKVVSAIVEMISNGNDRHPALIAC